jgi:hypothetical protein
MAPNDPLTLTVSPGGLVGPQSAVANATGEAHVSFSVPAQAAAGSYTVAVGGALSGTLLVSPLSVAATTVSPAQFPTTSGPMPRLVASGTGFVPGEWVDFSWTRNDGLDCCNSSFFGTFAALADGAGRVVASIQPDQGLVPGNYDVKFKGRIGAIETKARVLVTGIQLRNAQASALVRAIPANTPTTLVLRGLGYEPGEAVRLTGDAGMLGSTNVATASSVGDWQVSLPINLAAGVYSVNATGLTSGYTAPAVVLYVNQASAAPVSWTAATPPEITLAASGYAPGEAVTIDGGPFSAFSVPADQQGAVNAVVRATSTSAGQFKVHLKGATSLVDQLVTLYALGMTTSPSSATATVATSFTASGSGFRANEGIVASSMPGGLLAAPPAAAASSSGDVNITLRTLVGATPGVYTIVLTGQQSLYQATAKFVVTAVGAPILSVTPGAFTFSAMEGGASPVDQTLSLDDTSPGTSLTWTARVQNVTGGNWLSLSSTSGTATPSAGATISVRADATGLAPGTYTGQIVVDALPVSTTNAHVTVPVELKVSASSPSLGTLGGDLSFDAFVGSDAAAQSITISNTGGLDMPWTASTATTDGGSWLTLGTGSGTVGAGQSNTVTVSVVSAGLAVGVYHGSVSVSGDASTRNSPRSLNVTLTVRTRPTQADMAIPNTSFALSAAETVESHPAGAFSIVNNGGTRLNWSATIVTSNNTPWLALDANSGSVPANGGIASPGFKANSNGLFAGTYTATITLTDPDALHSPKSVTVTLTVTAP